jgi:signal peptidase II
MTANLSNPVGRWRWLVLAFLLWAVDQVIKFGVTQTMQLYDSIPVMTGFNWVYVLNPGAAFSFLADAGGWQRYFFTAFAFIISVVLGVLIWRGVASRLEAMAYALLIAGALGNATDRVRIGAVVDYLDVYWRTWHWPAFNVADICVSVAALLLVLGAWRQQSTTGSSVGQHRAT